MKSERLHADKIMIKRPNQAGLKQFSFHVTEGEILGIVGLKESGIQTLVNFLNGEIRSDSGQLLVNEVPVQINSTKQAKRLGIYCVNHVPHLIPSLSVAENLCIIRSKPRFRGYIRRHEMYEITQDLFDDFDIAISPNLPAGKLNISQQYALEILKAKMLEARIVILNDALSAYSENDFFQLLVLMRSMQENGTSFIIIESKLDRVMMLADRLTLIRNGQNAGDFFREEFNQDLLQRILLGQVYSYQFMKTPVIENTAWLQVKNLNAGSILKNVNFQTKRGEIVGFIDLGNGNFDHLFRILLGQADFDEGQFLLDNRTVAASRWLKGFNREIGYFGKPNLNYLLFEKLDVMDNIILVAKRKFSNRIGYIRDRISRYAFLENHQEMGLRVNDFQAKASDLTTEQQISLIFYKSFIKNASILLVEDPFAGADLVTQQRTCQLLQMAKERQMSVLFISHNISEVQMICDRAYLVRHGTIIGELTAQEMANVDFAKMFGGEEPL